MFPIPARTEGPVVQQMESTTSNARARQVLVEKRAIRVRTRSSLYFLRTNANHFSNYRYSQVKWRAEV